MATDNRIVGGQDALSPIPWQVSVQVSSFSFCGATILDASTLLSAAHCFFPLSNGSSEFSYQIRAGSIFTDTGGQVSLFFESLI